MNTASQANAVAQAPPPVSPASAGNVLSGNQYDPDEVLQVVRSIDPKLADFWGTRGIIVRADILARPSRNVDTSSAVKPHDDIKADEAQPQLEANEQIRLTVPDSANSVQVGLYIVTQAYGENAEGQDDAKLREPYREFLRLQADDSVKDGADAANDSPGRERQASVLFSVGRIMAHAVTQQVLQHTGVSTAIQVGARGFALLNVLGTPVHGEKGVWRKSSDPNSLPSPKYKDNGWWHSESKGVKGPVRYVNGVPDFTPYRVIHNGRYIQVTVPATGKSLSDIDLANERVAKRYKDFKSAAALGGNMAPQVFQCGDRRIRDGTC